jgi:MoxR-like ATPase
LSPQSGELAHIDDSGELRPDPSSVALVAQRLIEAVGQVIVGQDALVRDTVGALLAGGHVLLEGVPGLGKTALVRALGDAINLQGARVQFTPDLMPADIVGTMVIQEESGRRSFAFHAGPVFTNLLLADEVNRATPKTQSALLEAMQEHAVTVGGSTRPLPRPFFVLATQNPIELEGTYPLPEAQLDRFLYKLLVPFPSADELAAIARRTTGSEVPRVDQVLSGEELLAVQELVRDVPIADHVLDHAIRVLRATHPESSPLEVVRRHVRYGASPRGLQAMVLGGKVRALMEGRFNVAFSDLRAVAPSALRHRIVLGYEAEAEDVTQDTVVAAVLETIDVEGAHAKAAT